MSTEKVHFKTKRLLKTIPINGQHGFDEIVRHFDVVYPVKTKAQQVVNWLVLRAMIRYRLGLLLKAEYVVREKKTSLLQKGNRPVYYYHVTPKGVHFLNAK